MQGMPMRSGSQSSQNHSMSPHPSPHSASPQHLGMGGRHVSKGSSDASSGGAAPPAHRKRGGAQLARPATAGATPGRGFGATTATAAARRQAAEARRTAVPMPGGLHQKSASVAAGLSGAGGAAEYATGMRQVNTRR